jgi:hypothetical protein
MRYALRCRYISLMGGSKQLLAGSAPGTRRIHRAKVTFPQAGEKEQKEGGASQNSCADQPMMIIVRSGCGFQSIILQPEEMQ